MKKRIVIALIATLTLTLGSFGTAFAMNSNPVIELQKNEIFDQSEDSEEHVHTWGNPTYVIDQEAQYGEPEWIVTKPAEYEQIWVVDKEAVYQDVYDWVYTCYACGEKTVDGKMPSDGLDITAHVKKHSDELIEALNQYTGLFSEQDKYLDNYGFDFDWRQVGHYGGEGELVDRVLVSPEEGHYENGSAIISPEEGYWSEAPLISPEKGHWEHTCTVCGEIQNRDTGEVIKPGILPEEPTDPSEPTDPDVKPGEDTETPGEDTQKPGEDTQKPSEPEVKPEDGTETSVDWTAYLKQYCTMSWEFKLGNATRGQSFSANVTITNNGERTVEDINVGWIWQFTEFHEGTGEELSLQSNHNSFVIDSIPAGESRNVTLQNTIPESVAERLNGEQIYAYAIASYKEDSVALFTDTAYGTLISSQSGGGAQNPTDETEKPDQDTTTETDSNKQDQQNNGDKTTTPESADNKTAQTTDNKEQSDTAATVESNEDKAPQTGDTASLIYLAALAGSAVTGGTAFGLRRKFKK